MKKFLLLPALALLILPSYAQLRVGANVGIPVGNSSDAYGTSYGIDTYVISNDPDKIFKAGFNVSFLTFTGSERGASGQITEVDNAIFLPLALAARLGKGGVSFGPDLGYAVGLNTDGAFYLKLLFGFDLNQKIALNVFYNDTTKIGIVFNRLGLGVLYKL